MVKNLVDKLILLTEGKSDEEKEKIVKNFLILLKEKNKLHFLPEILRELKKAEEKRKMKLVLAREFNPDFLKELKEKIQKILGKKEVDIKIEPEIIGGFLAKDENYLIDGSIKGILNNFKQRVWTHLKF